ncbi:STAS domain-containing protein [Actinophytocola oryzae]|uniref:Anti-sigma-factor antagonist n=1 Tax=Actinophytocola oryzae TaxID=502181 RepID=A0A4R7W3V8_9PSEU|nr:STAS domain-containing protein [Actinophytocola oryzae]TDV57370.1 anti-sigma-factor antagonist [Actinophytocola oryzae]
MTSLPELTFTWDRPANHVGRVVLAGNIVHTNADELLRVVTDLLSDDPGLRELRLDCAGLDICDSRGLSTLLMLRRHTESLGLDLRIVNRPLALDRMLERTGTSEYLITDRAMRQDREPSG